jgi:tripartite-type tricarboxylate transporter receptor subunit TctC
MIKSGRIRPLAVTSSKRWPGAETIATVAEFGLPKFEHLTFIGLMAPKGTTNIQANTLSQAVMKVLADPAVTAKVASLGGEVGKMNAQEFKKFIDADYNVSRQIVQSTGMKPE